MPRQQVVGPDEAGMRLDRWFRLHFPALTHGRLEKLLRTGQVRIDGGRTKASLRLEAGQMVRIPPPVTADASPPPPRRDKPPAVDDELAAQLAGRILYRDRHILALAKPAGLAVQGGSKTSRHLDGALGGLRFGADDAPRLVHRLDKDTGGVLLLARDRKTAAELTAAFRGRAVRKIYWALVTGNPRPEAGRINVGLHKVSGGQGQRVVASDDGKRAVSLYRTEARAGGRATWLSLMPLSGRTHQLRVHCQAMGHPVVGDGKYGGRQAFLGDPVAGRLHLHARAIEIPRPGGALRISAPLDGHMLETWRFLGFEAEPKEDPFAAFEGQN